MVMMIRDQVELRIERIVEHPNDVPALCKRPAAATRPCGKSGCFVVKLSGVDREWMVLCEMDLR